MQPGPELRDEMERGTYMLETVRGKASRARMCWRAKHRKGEESSRAYRTGGWRAGWA